MLISFQKMISDTAFAMDKQGITVTATSRKLKVQSTTLSIEFSFFRSSIYLFFLFYRNYLQDFGKGPMSKGHLNLEDYGPNDPSPTTKAIIRPGPIQHGTPYIPYIPKPSRPAAPPAPLEPDHPELGALP